MNIESLKLKFFEALREYKLSQESESLEVDYYGSMQCLLTNNKHRLLVQWNGEEGFGFVEPWRNDEWITLETTIRENAATLFQADIRELCNEIKLLIQ